MSLVPASPKRLAALAVALAATLWVLALSVAAPASAETCPNFKVLHDDRIGVADLPAGNYFLQTADGKLSCQAAAHLFARFLQDWDGNLPKPWLVVSHGTGKASFARRGLPAIYVERISSGDNAGGNPELGKLCPGTFTVNAGTDVGPLYFAKGPYLLYIPTRSGITCRRSSVLFTRFLAAPGGMLPDPWQVKTQTATFFKPAHPLRSAFRVEPANGVS
ncbi:MAG TPA: hypothetical protein VFN18_01310 [Solirubrobacterales bacterium]|nr:hypothetical protein [Solirubrobacterales bacterium]